MKFVEVAIIILVSLTSAGSAAVTAFGLTYGDQAAKAAGEFPSRDVSLEVEALTASQEYANAAITGAVLGSLLSVGATFLGSMRLGLRFLWSTKSVSAFLRGASTGVMCMTSACMVFRQQPMGSQSLLLAAGVHAAVWTGFGTICVELRRFSNPKQLTLPFPIIAGAAWGVLFPTLAVLFAPDVYVERLFSTREMIAIWAGVGCAVLLTSEICDARRRRRILRAEMEGGAIP